MSGREPFVMVPTALVLAASSGAVRCWALLDDLARSDDVTRVDQASLARALTVSPRMLRYYLAELVAGGWVVTHRSGRASYYEPLRRPRVRPQPMHNPVDNPKPDRQPVATLIGNALPIAGRRHTYCARDEEARAREEGRGRVGGGVAGGAPAARRPWCGVCEERTRLRDVDASTVRRCPACHPSTAVPF